MSFSVDNHSYLLDMADFPVLALHMPLFLHRKSALQGTSAAVHTFCERQKPIPDGAGQYYVAGADNRYI